MILSRRAALNGQYLDNLYERIVITGIDFGAPAETINAVSRMGGAGQKITNAHYDTLEVTVKFAINVSQRDLFTRRQIFEDACKWALQGGWLTVNFMPDRKLYVDKVQIQNPGELRDWTGEYSFTFKAYGVPFWQDTIPASETKTSVSSSSFNMIIPGQYPTVAEAEFTNTSGSSVSTFSITVGSSTIALTGLSLANNKKLRIYHTDNGLLRITADGSSVYNKRSSASTDDLYVNPGTAAISMTAGGAGTLKVSCSGRYV